MSRMMMMVLMAYSDGFKDVHDYFRVILKSEEKSKRITQLTEDSLANYTVWKKGGARLSMPTLWRSCSTAER